jgi:hypothetical protein
LNSIAISRSLVGPLAVKVQAQVQIFRRRYVGHRVLMLESAFRFLERGHHRQDRLAALDRLYTTGAEAAAIADAIDVVDNRLDHVARAQEVGVQGMRGLAVHGTGCRDQRLADDLSAEHAFAAEIARLSAEQVFLELFEVEQVYEVLQDAVHDGRRTGDGSKIK